MATLWLPYFCIMTVVKCNRTLVGMLLFVGHFLVYDFSVLCYNEVCTYKLLELRVSLIVAINKHAILHKASICLYSC